MRRVGILAAIALVVSGLTAAVSAQTAVAADDEPVPFCSAPHAPPCLTTFQYDGSTANPATYRVVWNEKEPASGFYSVVVEKWNGGFWDVQMGTTEETHRFTIGLDFGSFNPRTAGGWGKPAPLTPTGNAVTWGGTDTHRTITLNLSPVSLLHGCTYVPATDTWNCPFTAPGEPEVGQISFAINNANWFGETVAEHDLIKGFYNFRSAEIGEAPPTIVTDSTGASTMVFAIQNPHESASHVTFHGGQWLRLPNSMMRDVYGIPAPSTMTSASLATSVTGAGSATVSTFQEDGDDAMIVNVTDVTFSKRVVRVKRGAVTPMRPGTVRGVRVTGVRGRVTYTKARARGAYPTSYVLRCVSGAQVRSKTVAASETRIVIRSLTPGRHYTCRVRATSKLGPGLWSFATTL